MISHNRITSLDSRNQSQSSQWIFLFVSAAITILAGSESKADGTITVNQFVVNWASEFNNNKADKLMAYYDPHDMTEIIMAAGIQFRGTDEIKQAYQEAERDVIFSKSRAEKIKTREFEKSAVVSFHHRYQFEIIERGERFAGHVRTTMSLQKIKGQWKIVAEHSSPISGIDRLVPVDEELRDEK